MKSEDWSSTRIAGRALRHTRAGAVAAVVAVLVASAPGIARGAGRIQPQAAGLQVRPVSGPPGTQIDLRGSGWGSTVCVVDISFKDASGVSTSLGVVLTNGMSSFEATEMVPANAALGQGSFLAQGHWLNPWTRFCTEGIVQKARATFTVTGIKSFLRSRV